MMSEREQEQVEEPRPEDPRAAEQDGGEEGRDGIAPPEGESEAGGEGGRAGIAPPEGESEAGGEERALQERYLRLAAEFDNFRKRTERERAESWARAQAQLIERFLDPLDDLRRVLETGGQEAPGDAVREGVRLVEAKLSRAMESAGLQAIGESGERFDPEVHEALMTGPAGSPEQDGTVGQVLQRGYTFKGMLLRPARVQVLEYAG